MAKPAVAFAIFATSILVGVNSSGWGKILIPVNPNISLHARHGRQAVSSWHPRHADLGQPIHPKVVQQSVREYSFYDHEAIVRGRILAIIDYVNRIQEK